MREILQLVLGLFLFTIGVTSIVTALTPRWRGAMRWRSGAKCGIVSGLGLGAVFAGGGLLCADPWLKAASAAGVLLVLAGLPAVILGDWLDHRKPKSAAQPDKPRGPDSSTAT